MFHHAHIKIRERRFVDSNQSCAGNRIYGLVLCRKDTTADDGILFNYSIYRLDIAMKVLGL